jgi:REP element-mobilizing transposase RayT
MAGRGRIDMPQSFYKLYYHIVWGTKKRLPLIDLRVEKWLKEYIPEKVSENGGAPLALDMVKDHVHLLLSIPPKVSVAEFVNKLKGSSSHYVNMMQNEKSFYWQAGYGVVSLSERGIPFVKQYIKNQKQRHKAYDLINILEYIPEKN